MASMQDRSVASRNQYLNSLGSFRYLFGTPSNMRNFTDEEMDSRDANSRVRVADGSENERESLYTGNRLVNDRENFGMGTNISNNDSNTNPPFYLRLN